LVVTTQSPGDLWYSRPASRQWTSEPPPAAAATFHAGLPGYRPTDLVSLPELARELGVGRVLVKDESYRFGLPAFKVLGASWAVARILTQDDSGRPDGAAGVISQNALRRAATARPVELVAATDGNHGRAVAWMGRMLGLPVTVFLPAVVPPAAAAAIAAEGAAVTVGADSYDLAVERAAAFAAGSERRVLVQDMAWPGYEQIPGWTVEGYGTVLTETDAQLAAAGLPLPDLVSIPVGVGSLAQAVVTHYRASAARGAASAAGGQVAGSGPALLAVEPDSAACVLASLNAGALVSVPTGRTIMAGLNCGTPSALAWPVLVAGLDAAIAVPDEAAEEAAVDLDRLGVQSGPTGAAALAGVRAALTGPGSATRRAELAITSASTLVLLSTEGRHE
jgi:diaminopropionate ammonia-lyase